jgi:hypothetical protein
MFDCTGFDPDVETRVMQVYHQARVVEITDPGTGERLTVRFPSGSAFAQFVRRIEGVSAAEVTAAALRFAASGRACISRQPRAPRRFRWAQSTPGRN